MTKNQKSRVCQSLAVSLMVGAVFYGGAQALGQISPIEAGARAAKPNGVPSCLATCPVQPARDHDGDRDDMQHPPSSMPTEPQVQAKPASNTAQTKSNTNQKAIAIAKNHSVAIAKNTAVTQQVTQVHVTKKVTQVTVQKPPTTQPQPEQEASAMQSQAQPEQESSSEQPPTKVVVKEVSAPQAESQSDEDQQPVVAQAAPVQQAAVAPAPLPATGNETALSTAVGTAVIAGAAYYYWISRRALLDSARN